MMQVRKNCVLGIAVLLLSAGSAVASPFTITTTGTVNSGNDPDNLFGAGAGLIGSTYTLTEAFSGLGASYTTDGSGQSAIDAGDMIPGSLMVTIGSTTLSTVLVANLATALLSETTSSLTASNGGSDAAGSSATALQNLSSARQITPFADLQTAFTFQLTAADAGVDSYSLSNAAGTQTASFGGTENSLAFAVSEPATWAVLGFALAGLSLVRRTRSMG